MVNKPNQLSKKQHYSTQEVAGLLGISRVAVFKQIKSGKIKATKIGRNYIIAKKDLPAALTAVLSSAEKHNIEKLVRRVVRDYGLTLKLLGKE